MKIIFIVDSKKSTIDVFMVEIRTCTVMFITIIKIESKMIKNYSLLNTQS